MWQNLLYFLRVWMGNKNRLKHSTSQWRGLKSSTHEPIRFGGLSYLYGNGDMFVRQIRADHVACDLRQCPYGAHTVPKQCPYSAHWKNTQCPYNQYIRLGSDSFLSRNVWALCVFTMGTVWAPFGHCMGTVWAPRFMHACS